MRGRYIYQLAATILPYGIGYDTVDHDLGIFTSLRTAKKVLRDYVKGGDFYCPVYSFSIMYLPVDNDNPIGKSTSIRPMANCNFRNST